MNFLRLMIGVVGIATIACGGNSDPAGPTAPGTSPVTATGLTVTSGTDLLLVGASDTYTATATFSDGASRSVTTTWSSDNESVVSVENSGRATARGPGMATLTARAEGRTASRIVRGLPDFAGSWRIQARETSCDVPGRWGAGFCNVSGLYTMTLQLNRAEGDRVTGTINNGIGWMGPVAAQVSIDGALTVTGRLTSTRPTVTFHSDLTQWQTRLSSVGMTGSFREILTWVGERDQGFASNEVIGATRSGRTKKRCCRG